MLQVGIHAAEQVAASGAPAGQNGGRQIAVVVALDEPEPGEAGGLEAADLLAGAVLAGVIDDQQLKPLAGGRQCGGGALDQGRNIGALIPRRNYQ